MEGGERCLDLVIYFSFGMSESTRAMGEHGFETSPRSDGKAAGKIDILDKGKSR